MCRMPKMVVFFPAVLCALLLALSLCAIAERVEQARRRYLSSKSALLHGLDAVSPTIATAGERERER